MKAAIPSAKSGPNRPIISSPSDDSKIGPAARSQWLSERLVQRSASCGPAARRLATASASGSTCSAGTALLTSPISAAVRPSIRSPVSR